VTGGLLSARMSAVDGAMETFRGARVAREVADGRGAPSERRAAAAAAEVRSQLGAGVGLAAVATRADENFPAGTVFLAADIAGAGRTEKVMLTTDRRRMREFSVISLLNLLRRALSS
jgi:nicotinamide mononucleotide (NMN) deamidase PncC